MDQGFQTQGTRKVVMVVNSQFYEQLLCQFPFAKKIQIQIVGKEKQRLTHLDEKTACKMLLK